MTKNNVAVPMSAKVEQCDRMNAAALVIFDGVRERILAGLCDDRPPVQAFAAERVAERERCVAEADHWLCLHNHTQATAIAIAQAIRGRSTR